MTRTFSRDASLPGFSRFAGLLLGGFLSLGLSVSSAQDAQPQPLFGNNNIYAVQNGPTRDAVVALDSPVIIAKITTYHWNNGRGTRRPGTISIQNEAGEIYGPWQATGAPGQGGVRNAMWVAYPNVNLPAGTYTVIDSEPATWSHNAASGGAGMTWAEGYFQ